MQTVLFIYLRIYVQNKCIKYAILYFVWLCGYFCEQRHKNG